MNRKGPPDILLRFFRWYCHPKLRDSIEGDLTELYAERERIYGKRSADLRCIADIILLCRPGIIRPMSRNKTLIQTDMFLNYIKIAWRVIVRSKGYSFINISGLAIGMTASMLILLWVGNEIGYDRFYPDTNRIYQLFSRDQTNGRVDVWGNTPALLAPELKQSYPEVEDAVRFRRVFFLLKVGENRFNDGGGFADPGFLSMFSFPMVKGLPDALNDDFGIVLSKPMAIKLFGKTDCLGETVLVNEGESFKVTGVLEDLPPNTDFEFGYLLPWNYMTRLGWDAGQTWANTNAGIYVKLKEGASADAFGAKIINIVRNNVKEGDGFTREVIIHPLSRIHLYSRAENGEFTGGRIETVRLFTSIAVLIILIACINFMNLSTARSEKRAKEVGVRKIVGAFRIALITQFISESLLAVLIAFVLSIIMVQVSLGPFNQMVGTTLHIPFGDWQFWMIAIGFIAATGLIAGSYPAFFLSASRPAKVLKGAGSQRSGMVTPRKVLVVLQFTFAIMLSICAVMVQQQIQFAQNRDAGYERHGISYNFLQGEIPNHYDLIKDDLLASGAVVSVTRTFSPVVSIWNFSSDMSWPGSSELDKKTTFLFWGADANLVNTFGISVVEGRELDVYNFPSDTAGVLLNEAAARIMRLSHPVGERIRNNQGQSWEIVGVVRDFIVNSPYETVDPMLIVGWTPSYGVVNFKFNKDRDQAGCFATAEAIFRRHNPEYPFDGISVSGNYNRKFGDERRTGTLAGLFAALTVFISCLGLFGLAAYMAESRTKEVGIRKTLGASVFSVASLLSQDFIRLVLLAIPIGSGLAWYFVTQWLLSFTYRVPVSLWVFVNTGIAALVIALFTVSSQAVRAATVNPVKSLRSE